MSDIVKKRLITALDNFLEWYTYATDEDTADINTDTIILAVDLLTKLDPLPEPIPPVDIESFWDYVAQRDEK